MRGARLRSGIGVCLLVATTGCGPATRAVTLSPHAAATATGAPTPSPTALAAGILLLPESCTGGCYQPSAYSLTLVLMNGGIIGPVRGLTRSVCEPRPLLPSGCPPRARATPLPVFSASHDRAYYLDGNNLVRFIGLDGSSGTAFEVPGSDQAQSAFAVSPDDQRIAVGTIDYTTMPATGHLVVEGMHGEGRREIFTSTKTYVWPVGWHSGQLVLAVGPEGVQNTAPNPYSAGGYHVVDPAAAIRSVALPCANDGPLSPGGALCTTYTVGSYPNVTTDLVVYGWDGSHHTVLTQTDFGWLSLSPDGSRALVVDHPDLAVVDMTTGSLTAVGPLPFGVASSVWIDAAHILVAGLGESALVIDATTRRSVPVKAQGEAVGRVPGDL